MWRKTNHPHICTEPQYYSVLVWSFQHKLPVCIPENSSTNFRCVSPNLRARLMRIYVTYRFVRWRRARDRNPGARRNRALQLTASSDITTQSRRTGHRHRRILPPNRHNTPETYIDFIARSCIWRQTIPGDNIVWADTRETEGNVLVGARVRPLPHLAQLLALFGALIPVHGTIVAIFKITCIELLLRQSFSFWPNRVTSACLAFSGISRHIGFAVYCCSCASTSSTVK